MSDRTVSIIVAVYNVEEYLDDCIQHVINQTYTSWELVLVDDGSTDRSPQICDDYARQEQRIKVIHQENKGVSKARNAGLNAASGEFILFCDSDDWMDEKALSFFLELQSNNDADLVFGDICTVRKSVKKQIVLFNQAFDLAGREICNGIIRACIGYGYNPYPTKPYPLNGLGSVGNKLYKLSIIKQEKIQFTDETNGIYEDNLFTIQYLLKANRVCYKSEPVYYYRQLDDSSIHRYRAESLDTSKRIFDKVTEIIASYENQQLFQKAFYILVIRRLSEELRVYFFHKDSSRSVNASCSELRRIIRSKPYKQAIRNVELSRLLPAHKATAIVAKTGSAYLLWLFYLLRSHIKRRIR